MDLIFGMILSSMLMFCSVQGGREIVSLDPNVQGVSRVNGVLQTGQGPEAKRPDTTLVDRLRAITDHFLMNFYHEISSSEGQEANIFFSPLSIYSAMLMTYFGARGETRSELGTVLCLNDAEKAETSPDYFSRQFLKFIGGIFTTGGKDGGNYQLDLANRLCVQENVTVRAEYSDILRNFYNSGIVNYDFTTESEHARMSINAWVSNVTRAKIPNLLPVGTVSPQTQMLLVNAIYFKADWQYKFDPAVTQEMKFFINGSDRFSQVKMMSTRRKIFYGYDRELKAQVVEIPYQSEELSMVVVLPKTLTGLDHTLSEFNADKWKELHDSLDMTLVDLMLPRFKLETSYDLVGALGTMGAQHLFAGADFSGMFDAANVGISGVVHKAFVDVNEEGTEAAAATGVVFSRSAVVRPDDAREFRADHPFLFAIRHNPTNLMLFMGRVKDPSVSH